MITITLYTFYIYYMITVCIYLFGLRYDCKKIITVIYYKVSGHQVLLIGGLKKLTSFNNNTLSQRIQNDLASWMFRILSLFDFQNIDCGKAPEVLSQCLYGCIRKYGSNN